MTANRKLFFLCSFCIFVGIIASYSLTTYTVLQFGYSHFHFFIRQLIVGLISIFIMWFLARLDPDKYFLPIGFSIFFIFFSAIVILSFLPESLAVSAGGAKRWIRLPGISLAPTEFFKVGFVVALAWSFERQIKLDKETVIQELLSLIRYFVVFLVIVYFILIEQNDFGQTIVLGTVLIIMIFFAGISVRFFTVLGAFSVAMAIVLIRFSENKLTRFKLWWSHVQDFVLRLLPDNIADFLRAEKMPEQYQLSHSLNAINHGGLFGNGIGNGLEKLGPLSEIHTDFVLAGISEEIGAIAVIIIALIFFVIIHTIFKIANRCENKTHTLFALGVGFLMIFAPFMINAFGIMGITPIKGIAVPFISYGGSSLLATSIGIGMVLMISKKAKP